MKTMFNLIKRSGEVSFRDISEITPGCTLNEEMDDTIIATYSDEAEALEALKSYTATVYSYNNLKNRLVITEYLVEEYTADDDGEFISGSDFTPCAWPDTFCYHGKTYTMQPYGNYLAIWYALMTGPDDTDWGTGTFDRDEAFRRVREMRDDYPDAYIAVIDDGPDPICIEEIHDI